MIIDERTLVLICAVASLVTASIFASLARTSRVDGLRWWSAGYLSVALSFGSAVVPIADWRIASLVFNVPIAWGHVLILIGTLRFLGRRVPWRVVGILPLLPVLITAWFTFALPRADLRVGLLAALDFGVVGWTALEFLRTPARHDRRSYQVTGVVLLVQAFGTLAQSLLALSAGPSARYALPEAPAANLAAWASVLLATLVCSQTLLLLVAQRLIAALHDAAHHDPLTGCLNRRGLREALEGPLAAAIAARAPAAVLMMDVDHFKAVNDRHGHALGDRVLEALGAVLRESRDEAAFVARWGGEEFIAVLLNASADEALPRARTVRERFAAETTGLGELSSGCTLSVGLAAGTLGDRVGLTDLRESADAALYEAKRRGRDRIEVAAKTGSGGPHAP
jgi:diguanylate cyclase (GGDEF)-like protein